MIKYIDKKKIDMLVREVRGDFNIVLRMMLKYGDYSLQRMDHGLLHLDFDNRHNTPWNNELLWLFPMEMPVALTSYKGIIYGHCLDNELTDYNCMGTGDILADMIMKYGDESKIREMMISRNIID